MSTDLNEQTNQLLREQLTGLAHQLNVLIRIAKILKIISIVLILCAIMLAWPLFVTVLGASAVIVALGLDAIPRGVLYAILGIPMLLAIVLELFKFWSRYVNEASKKDNGYADPDVLKKIEIARRKREKDLEAEMVAYFEKKRAEN
jgi:energy-coupling factor transporter transmembrane protein EcfT